MAITFQDFFPEFPTKFLKITELILWKNCIFSHSSYGKIDPLLFEEFLVIKEHSLAGWVCMNFGPSINTSRKEQATEIVHLNF